ncbi:hypothetical protein C5S31_11780 [ANME-1 cluster archaeon GoMg2]|nr:hypothetical protein [ANME-1 cluster archaeon GoMg2]
MEVRNRRKMDKDRENWQRKKMMRRGKKKKSLVTMT